jgi:hypothetical protein
VWVMCGKVWGIKCLTPESAVYRMTIMVLSCFMLVGSYMAFDSAGYSNYYLFMQF